MIKKIALGGAINYNAYGPFYISGMTDAQVVRQDIKDLYRHGWRKLRMRLHEYRTDGIMTNYPTINYVADAINAGFTRVIIGITFKSDNTFDSSKESEYLAAVQTFATWCEAQTGKEKIEFQVNNEGELHHAVGYTDAQYRAFMLTCAAAAKAIFTSGTVSIASSCDKSEYITLWKSDIDAAGGFGTVGLDRVTFNTYDTSNGSTTYINFVTNVNLVITTFPRGRYTFSEYGPSLGFFNYHDDASHALAMKRRMNALINAGAEEAYAFAYRYTPNSTVAGLATHTQWALKTMRNTYRLAYAVLLGVRPWYGPGDGDRNGR